MGYIKNKAKAGVDTYRSYLNYIEALEKSGFDLGSDKENAEFILGKLVEADIITAKDYKAAIHNLDNSRKAYGDGWFDKGTSFWDTIKDIGYGMFGHTTKTHKQTGELYDKMAENIPLLTHLQNATAEDLHNSFYEGITNSPGVAGPSYIPNVDLDFAQREVEPVKFWTGQELADLHNINFNPDTYYDLIKKGTSAAVDLANYQANQVDSAALQGELESNVSYLDSIRNAKAEAISKGATMGQRAARDIMNNREQMQGFADAQSKAVDTKMKTVDKMLLDDAKARITARDYYNQLAQSLARDSIGLYSNDSYRYGQDMIANAELYGANANLQGAIDEANANMYNNYLTANSSVNRSNKMANASADEYAWIFDNAVKANNGDVSKAFRDVDNYITHGYTGKSNVFDYIESVLNK